MNLQLDSKASEDFIFYSSPTLVLLPKLEVLINKEEPTLQDILKVCSHDSELLEKLTRRSGFGGNHEDFARDILFKKGLGFLKSLAIRTMNQEIFELPLGLNNLSTNQIKRRSIILARFLKHFANDLRNDPDELYLSGLLYNFPYVVFEHLVKDEKFPEDSFENVESDVVTLTCNALSKIGFNKFVITMIEDSIKPIQITDRVCEHALLRMANDVLEKTELTNTSIGRRTNVSRNLLEMTGYSEKIILNSLREISRNYKGSSVSWS